MWISTSKNRSWAVFFWKQHAVLCVHVSAPPILKLTDGKGAGPSPLLDMRTYAQSL